MRAWAKPLALAALSVLCVLASASAASATTYTVNDQTDAALSEPAGVTCASTNGGSCTLRAAVQAADNTGGSDTIELPAGEYKLTLTGSGEAEPQAGDLDIQGSTITITGARAASTIINPGERSRAFHVHPGAGLTLTRTTVIHGEVSPTTEDGGAFFNEGTLSIEHCVLDSNLAQRGGAVAMTANATSTSILYSKVENNAAEYGGVILTEGGEVTLAGDTIDDNNVMVSGGVLYADELVPGPVNVSRSTIDKNESGGSGGAFSLQPANEAERELGELTVSLSTFHEDTSGEGGAIYGRDNGPVTVSGSTFSNDTASSGPGGAMFEAESSSISVGTSSFTEDTGTEGGAIYTGVATLSLTRSTFSGDHAKKGGALLINAPSPAFVTTSTFAGNEATETGGAIYRFSGGLTITASTLSGNTVTGDGGAISVGGEETFELTNDTLEGNQATVEGGALYLDASFEPQETLLNDTIARNSAPGGEGGGISNAEDALSIKNTIVVENTGGDCESHANAADQGGNVDSDGSCFTEAAPDNHLTVEHPKVAALAANGGPTETDELESGSVAIAGGVPLSCPATDQRGVTRQNEPCDSGAYQVGEYIAPVGPSVETDEIEEDFPTEAPVFGSVNPNGVLVTSCEFEYGTSTSYGASMPCAQEPGASSTPEFVTALLEELTPGTTYDFRLVARNANVTNYGANQTFVTPAEATTTTTTTSSSSSTTTTTTTTTTTSAPATTTTTTATTTSASPGPAPVSGSVATVAPAAPCRSTRVETVSWRVHPGSFLRRILVTRNGVVYRVLKGGARRIDVSLVGMLKGTVVVRIIGIGSDGRRYGRSVTFHTCVPAAPGGSGAGGVPFLNRR